MVNGAYREHLIGLTKGLRLEDRIDFFQDLPREKLLFRYVAADPFLLHSRYESFSIVVAEALVVPPCTIYKRQMAPPEDSADD